jgi:hypothetical protein
MVSVTRYVLAALPAAMLLATPVIADRVEPRILGLPFIFAWLIAWVFVSPLFMLAIERMRTKA